MEFSARRVVLLSILAFIMVWVALPQLAQSAEDRAARVPHNAFSKVSRADLAEALRTQGELRVIVGLQTPQESLQQLDPTPDSQKAQVVAARQGRLLGRLAGRNVRDVKYLRHHHFVAMTVDNDALDALLADPEVTSITEDRPVYPVLNDTPGITRADKAWADGFRGGGQIVAIIDSGVDKAHDFFKGKVVAEACFSAPVGSNISYCPSGATQSFSPGSGAPCNDYSLGCWHGTHVAGIAAGRTGVLSSTTGGIAPDAGVIAIQIFQRECVGTSCGLVGYDSDVIAALDHVYSLRATYNIASINMSLGGDLYTAACDSALPGYKTIIDSLRNVNIATVIAAGNNGSASALSAPGCISSAISVGSTTKANAISSFSNSASFLTLLAPGSAITSSLPSAISASGFGTASGTSMATPHVAGAWAVLKSAKPTATVSEVLTALQNTGLPITDPRNGIVKPLIKIGNDGTQTGALGMLVVHENAPPSVTLTAPANNAVFTAPANIAISATATDSDGTISRVEFYNGPALINTDTTLPYTFNWANVAAGSYSLTAKAIDNNGATATSAAISITVNASVSPTTATPVAAYQFNDAWGTSGVITDTVAGRNGVRTGAVSPIAAPAVPPKPNTCQGANFTGGAVDVSALPVATAAGAKTTVAFWIYWNGGSNAMPVSWQTQDLIFYGGSFGFNSGNGDIYGISSSGLANGWHHVVAEFTNGNIAGNKLYIDGVLRTLTQRLGTPNNARAIVSANLRMGGLYGSTSYRFAGRLDEVKLFNGALTSADVSAEYAAASPCAGVPAPPSGLSAVAAGTRINLTWTDSSSDETGFKLERKAGAGGTYGQIATPLANATSYSDTAVTAGNTYVYRIRATNSVGDSAYSNEATASINATGATPVAAYQFNDAWGTSGVITDTVAGRNGVRTGAVSPIAAPAVPPKPNTCQGANFTGGAVDVSALPVATAAGAKTTVAFWIYWNGGSNAMPVSWQTQDLIFYGGSFGFNSGNGDIYGISSSGLANGWHHVVAEFTNGNIAGNKLYIDGVLRTLTQRLGTPNNARAVVSANLRMGGLYGSTSYRFAGRLDEVKLFNGALTSADVSAEYAAAPACPQSPPPSISLQSVATGLSSPVDITNARDGSGRLFIVQQTGQIKILSGGQILPDSFLDIQALIASGSERGLLGLAFHPNYATNGYFYLNYTRQGDGATVIARYQRSAANPDIADPASASILLTVAQPFSNHNGGQLRFGPDGYLYIGLGDGGSSNDPGNRAQSLNTLLGKMLRIDVNGASPYAIPAGNPFQNDGNSATLPEIWAYGLRNPWRFSFDRLTGDLFIADVGQSAWEEINFQPAGTGGGANYGWRTMEGAHCTGLTGGPPCFDPRLVLPILEYGHNLGCSVTGGHRYRGAAYPTLEGYFVFGDYCTGRIWGATNASGNWTLNELLDTTLNISTFGEDEAGELYVAAYNTGVIYRISAVP